MTVKIHLFSKDTFKFNHFWLKQIHSLNLPGLSILLYLKHFWLCFVASYCKNPEKLHVVESSEDVGFHMSFSICIFFFQDSAFRVTWACEKSQLPFRKRKKAKRSKVLAPVVAEKHFENMDHKFSQVRRQTKRTLCLLFLKFYDF